MREKGEREKIASERMENKSIRVRKKRLKETVRDIKTRADKNNQV